MPMTAWPPRNKEKIDNIVRAGGGLYDLWETSPVRFEPSIRLSELEAQPADDARRPDLKPQVCSCYTEEIVDALFPGDPLLCVGRSVYKSATRRREFWRGSLSDFSLIVPNPMTKVTGMAKNSKESEHTLDNTGPRRFLTVEFDFSEKARDGKTDTEWATVVRAWRGDAITVADACAALLMHLALRAPLALAAHSGGKSLHGWFYCFGRPEEKLHRFMREAHTLGADPAT